jgi:hypothetical protein
MVDLSNTRVSKELAQDREMLYSEASHTLGPQVCKKIKSMFEGRQRKPNVSVVIASITCRASRRGRCIRSPPLTSGISNQMTTR